MFYTYIIFSKSKNRYYTGYTSSTPQDRLNRHNNGMTPSTKSGIPWELVFFKSFDSKSDAIKFENFIKRQKSQIFIKKLIASNKNEFPE
ncbi:GIY-YIG nuclease family protein [Rhodohalobacter barkolensis]|uniref:Excinuclease ABC subunit C n=1 Tax=Rhodohalobacter barkolensis TaxID=2053187 RepID=A0A2N0VFS2_9BACT|nr:excinuclease ABC subunit C [Rhodohalobacter barkolensis]